MSGESQFGLVLMDERGRATSILAAIPGLNGGVAVSRQGTTFADVQTLGFGAGITLLPRRFRAQLERLPEATLEVGTFLRDSVTLEGGGFTAGFNERAIAAYATRPALSADGRRVVFARERAGHVQLFSAATTRLAAARRLTTSPGRDLNPRWSADGRLILFERHVGSGADLYAVRPDGSELRRLTYLPGRELYPDLSPDGRSLVFSSDLPGHLQLYVLDLATSVPRRLTDTIGDDTRAAWSPDGRWIAFSSNRDGDDDVYLVRPDGSSERKLTSNASQDLVQAWQPVYDARRPVVRALPSLSKRGRNLVLRLRVSDNSARVRIDGSVTFDVTEDLESGEAESYIAPLPESIVGTRGRGVHVMRVPVERLLAFDDAPELPAQGRFCVVAIDPWGNGSKRSCARFRLR